MAVIHEKTMSYGCFEMLNRCMAAYTLMFRGCRCQQHVLRAVFSLVDWWFEWQVCSWCNMTYNRLQCWNDGAVKSTSNDWCLHVRWEDDAGAISCLNYHVHKALAPTSVFDIEIRRSSTAHATRVANSIAVLNYRCFGGHLHKVIAKGWGQKLAKSCL